MQIPRWLAFAARIVAASMAVSILACGGSVGEVTGALDAGPSPAVATGSVSVEMQLPVGSPVSMASYTLTGPHSFYRSSMMSFAGTRQVDFGIDQVPASTGYNLDVTLTSPDGSNVCTSSAQFEVDAAMTATVALIPHCSQPSPPPAPTATLQLTVELPVGVSLANLAFSLLGADGFQMKDTWKVVGDSALLFVIQNIPAGTGDYLAVSATSSDGDEACNGKTTVSFESNATTEATLVLQCAAVADGAPL